MKDTGRYQEAVTGESRRAAHWHRAISPKDKEGTVEIPGDPVDPRVHGLCRCRPASHRSANMARTERTLFDRCCAREPQWVAVNVAAKGRSASCGISWSSGFVSDSLRGQGAMLWQSAHLGRDPFAKAAVGDPELTKVPRWNWRMAPSAGALPFDQFLFWPIFSLLTNSSFGHPSFGQSLCWPVPLLANFRPTHDPPTTHRPPTHHPPTHHSTTTTPPVEPKEARKWRHKPRKSKGSNCWGPKVGNQKCRAFFPQPLPFSLFFLALGSSRVVFLSGEKKMAKTGSGQKKNRPKEDWPKEGITPSATPFGGNI